MEAKLIFVWMLCSFLAFGARSEEAKSNEDTNNSEIQRRFRDGRYVREEFVETYDDISPNEDYFGKRKDSFSGISGKDDYAVPTKLSKPFRVTKEHVSYEPQDYYFIREQLVPFGKKKQLYRGVSKSAGKLGRYGRNKRLEWMNNWNNGRGHKATGVDTYTNDKQLDNFLMSAKKNGKLDESLVDTVKVIEMLKRADRWESIIKTMGYWDEEFEELKNRLAREGKNPGASYKPPLDQRLIGRKELIERLTRAGRDGKLDKRLIEMAKTIDIFKTVAQWEDVIKGLGYWDEDFEKLKKKWNGGMVKKEPRRKGSADKDAHKNLLSKKDGLIKQFIKQNKEPSFPKTSKVSTVSSPKKLLSEKEIPIYKKDPRKMKLGKTISGENQLIVDQKGNVKIIPGSNKVYHSNAWKTEKPKSIYSPVQFPENRNPRIAIKNPLKIPRPVKAPEQNNNLVLNHPAVLTGKLPLLLHRPIGTVQNHSHDQKPNIATTKCKINKSAKPKTEPANDHVRGTSRYGIILDVFNLPPNLPGCFSCNSSKTSRRSQNFEKIAGRFGEEPREDPREDIDDNDDISERMLVDEYSITEPDDENYGDLVRSRRSAEPSRKSSIIHTLLNELLSKLLNNNQTIAESKRMIISSVYKFIKGMLAFVDEDLRFSSPRRSSVGDKYGGADLQDLYADEEGSVRGIDEEYDQDNQNDYSLDDERRTKDDENGISNRSNRVEEAEENDEEYLE